MGHLHAGAARVDITPPVGSLLAGYAARTEPSCGVHDPLWACALFVDDGERQVALVTMDTVAAPADLVSEVRQALAQSAGLEASQVLVCATHCHSGPGFSPMDEASVRYRSTLGQALSNLVLAAMDNRRRAQVRCFNGSLQGIAANRRPGGGPVDPQVGVVALEADDGALIAVLLNYTCHATVLGADNLLITADYPGYARRAIEHNKGSDVIILFTNGALGNINPGGYSPELSMIGHPIPQRTFADAERLGVDLGSEVLRVLDEPGLPSHPRVDSRCAQVALPLKVLPDRRQAEAERTVRQHALAQLEEDAAGGDAYTAAKMGLAYAELQVAMIPEMERLGAAAMAEIQALRLGDAYLVGIPGEPFVEIGLDIKGRSRLRHVFVVGLANGSLGYLPTDDAFAEGGYEPATAKVAPGAASRIADAALCLLQDLSSR